MFRRGVAGGIRRGTRDRADAELLYMHPVKALSDICPALETYRIRTLALDHPNELEKIRLMVQALDLDPGEVAHAFEDDRDGREGFTNIETWGSGEADAAANTVAPQS